MKRLLAVLTAMALLICSLPMMSFAEEEQYDEVSYTDLFYGYDSSTYLRSQHLKTYTQQTSEAMEKIFNEYMDSPSFFWTKIETSLNASLNLGDWFKLISDANFGTDYNYNEALDAANVLLVQYLFDRVGTGSQWGIASETIELAEKEVESFDILLKSTNQKGLTGTEFIKSAFDYLKNSTMFSFVSKSQLTTIENAVITKSDTVAKCFSVAGDLAGAMKALLVALMMEDFRIELIDTILAECETSMTLYDGLTRLKTQLRDGFASYFIDNYLNETVLKKLAEASLDFVLGTANLYKMVTNIVSVVSTLLFDKLFDVADMDDMLLQVTLNDYSGCLYRIMQSMWSEFDSTAFTGTRIKVYELVFDVFIAATNAAMEASTKLTLSTNEDYLYNVWSLHRTFSYYEYKEWIQHLLQRTPNSEREMKPTDVVLTYSDFDAIMLPADTAAEGIVYLFRGALNGNVNVKKSSTVPKELKVTVNGNVTANGGELTIEEDATVTVNGNITVNGNGYIYNNGILTTTGNFASNATKNYVSGENSNIIFAGTTQQTVKNLKACNIEVTNSAGLKYLSDIYVYGTYKLNSNPLDRGSYYTHLCDGAVLMDDSKYDIVKTTETVVLRSNINASAWFYGNVSVPAGTSYSANGTIWVSGNLTIPSGATFTINGKLMVNSGGKLTIEEGATLVVNGECEAYGNSTVSVENGGTLIVNGLTTIHSTLTFKQGATVLMDDVEIYNYNNSKLTISAGASCTIGGSVTVHDESKLVIEEGALLTINGNLQTEDYRFNSGDYGYVYNNGNLILRGNFSPYKMECYIAGANSKIIFAGTEQQTVRGLKAYDIEVTNPAGIKYLSNVYVYGTYKLNGNPLDRGSYYTFIYNGARLEDDSDYKDVYIDGAGMLQSNINGNVTVRYDLTIPSGTSYTISGNITVNGSSKKLTIEEGATLIVNGNLTASNYNRIYNNGTLIVNGNLTASSSSYIYNNGTLVVKGDFAPYGTNYYVPGANSKIVFAGTEQQTVKYLKAYDIDVTNPAGIKYLSDVSVYGTYELHGNPLDCGSYYTYLYNGATLMDDSEYKAVYVSGTMDLQSNINGNVTVSGNLTIPSGTSYTINGNVTVNGSSKKLTIEEGATLTINGSVTSASYAYIYNNGTLIVNGNLTASSNGYIYNNGTLLVKGNFAPYGTNYYVSGANSKIVFAGTEQQTVKYLKAYDVEVTNPAGIKYLSKVEVYGTYELHGNPLDNNGYSTYLYNGAVLMDDSEYKAVYVSGTMDLQSNINGNVTVSGNLTIPSGTSYTINGNVTVNGSSKKLTIEEGATLIVNGNLTASSSSYIYNNGTLIVKGDFAPYGTSYYVAGANSKIIFAGDAKQTVKYLKSPVIILENESEEGVVFSSSVTASKLFDHKGKVFTLYNNGTGSIFADYDGDGVKDHLDAQPTVGNPCVVQFVSSDETVGTVDTAVLDTVGGTEITVTATPTAKYELQAWVDENGKTLSTAATFTFVATGDMTYTAVFVKRSQPITVDTVGGKITTPSKAEIESAVTVTVTENEGYIFEDGSLAMNGQAVVDNTFVMPDEPVTLTATFTYNEHYFALKDAITTAAAIGYSDWSAGSYADLQAAITDARAVLENHITAEVSAEHIVVLQAATEALTAKYPVSLTVTQTDEQYLYVENLAENLSVTVVYDNGTTMKTTAFTVANFDAAILGEQTVTVGFEDVSQEITVTVHRRQLTDVTVTAIADQLYGGEGTVNTPKPVLTYKLTGEVLTEGVDYTLTYIANDAPGAATVTATGIGDYEGELSKTFTIYCEHDYVVTEYQAPTCTEDGFEKKACSICGEVHLYDKDIVEGLPESPHNYSNSMNKSYSFTYAGSTSLVLHFSASTQTEKNYDFIHIYDGNDKLIGTYTGTALASKSITVAGDTVRIRLASDGSVVYYGFSLTSITVKSEDGVLPATGHTFGDRIIEREATPLREGLSYRECVHGDAREEMTIPCTQALATEALTLESELLSGIACGTTAAELYTMVSSAYTLTVYNGETAVADDALIATGYTLVVSGIDNEVYATYTLSVTGDVNGDGVISTRDARCILQALASDEDMSAAQRTAADFDGDSILAVLDARALLLSVLAA